MVVVAQLVRALDCDSRGRGFEPHHPPTETRSQRGFFHFKGNPKKNISHTASHTFAFFEMPVYI
jgi:hypothetical protein